VSTEAVPVILNFFRPRVFLATFALPTFWRVVGLLIVFTAPRGRPRRFDGLIPSDPNAASMSAMAST